jgi:hypothetical protein
MNTNFKGKREIQTKNSFFGTSTQTIQNLENKNQKNRFFYFVRIWMGCLGNPSKSPENQNKKPGFPN